MAFTGDGREVEQTKDERISELQSQIHEHQDWEGEYLREMLPLLERILLHLSEGGMKEEVERAIERIQENPDGLQL